ncbi:hypothetical protein ABLB47_02840 [Vibrio parahaemolyticus]
MANPSIYKWFLCINKETKQILINTSTSNACAFEDKNKALEFAQYVANQLGTDIEVIETELVHLTHLRDAEARIIELEKMNFRMQKLMELGLVPEDLKGGNIEDVS